MPTEMPTEIPTEPSILAPPQPLPENIWGDRWQFVTLDAESLELALIKRPIPVLSAPPSLLPSAHNLSPSTPIPGVVIEAGRRSLKLAQWIHAQHPVRLGSVLAELNGLLLHTAAQQRWILMTYDDPTMAETAKAFEQQKLSSQTLHFLMIQPDDSGITQSGLWLLHHRTVKPKTTSQFLP